MQEERDGTHVLRGSNASWELTCSLCGVVAKYLLWVKMWPTREEAGLPEWRCPECWNYEV